MVGMSDVKANIIPLAIGGTVGAAVVGAGVIISSRKKKKTTSKKKKKTTSKKKKKTQRKPYTAGKGKDRSTRRIRYTKNNQPYVILKSGKARFISKKSARLSRKKKGGRY